MARRRRSSFVSVQRGTFVTTRLPAVPLLRLPRSVLQLVEDRREFHPDGVFRPARAFGMRRNSDVVIGQLSSGERGSKRFGADLFHFAVPRKVVICVRRKERREVLFANRKTGRGARAPRSRNWFSDISCERR